MGLHSTRAEGYEDWLEETVASRTSASQTAKKKKVAKSSISDPQKSTCEQCNANEVYKKLSKLSFKDKGVRVGFGSIKH